MIHICEICGYNTKRVSNFKAHKSRKNKCVVKESGTQCNTVKNFVYNVNNIDQDNVNIVYNVNNIEQDNVNIVYLGDNNVKTNNFMQNQCKLCEKCFSTKSNLKKHERKCNGLHKLQCPTCFKFFKSAGSKYNHKKRNICSPPDKLTVETTSESKDNLCKEINELKEQNEMELLRAELKKLRLLNIKLLEASSKSIDQELKRKNRCKNQFTAFQKKEIACNQDWQCNLCSIKLPPNYEIDHIESIANGGEKNIENGQALCKPCHEKKL